MHLTSRVNARTIATALALTAVNFALGACNKDSANTAPLVATSIVATAATNAQATTVGQPTPQPVSVVVTDQNGVPLQNAMVTWTVVNHSGTTGSATSETDASGTATTTWTVDTIARTDSLTASIFSGGTVTITAIGQAGAATTATKVSGDAQTDSSTTTSAPFVIMVADRYGNAVSGAAVAWVVTGGGTLSAAMTNTDITGRTSTTLTLGSVPGPYVITATAGLLAAVTFNLTGT
jgi:protocatechuate 3,4-dioxygenase beta subunit